MYNIDDIRMRNVSGRYPAQQGLTHEPSYLQKNDNKRTTARQNRTSYICTVSFVQVFISFKKNKEKKPSLYTTSYK